MMTITTDRSSSSTAHCRGDDIRKALAQAGLKNIHPDVLSKCVALSSTLQLSAKQMGECWEAFSLNKSSGSSSSSFGMMDLTDESTFASFRNELIKESTVASLTNSATTTSTTTTPNHHSMTSTIIPRSSVKRQIGTPAANDMNRNAQDDDSMAMDLPMVTPPAPKRRHHHISTSSSADEDDDDDVGDNKVGIDNDMLGNKRTSLSAVDAVMTTSSQTKTKITNNTTNTFTTLAPHQYYHNRTNAGQVLVRFPPKSATTASPVSSSSKFGNQDHTRRNRTSFCRIQQLNYSDSKNNSDGSKQLVLRHMFTTMDERATALDVHLLQIEQAMQDEIEDKNDHLQNDEEAQTQAVAPVGVPRQDEIVCIGRICNEAAEGRINSHSMVLEGCRRVSGGCRIPLDLSHITMMKSPPQTTMSYLSPAPIPFSFFPGQIVALRGYNRSGRTLVTHGIVSEGVPLPPATTPIRQLLEYYHHEDGNGTSVMVEAATAEVPASENRDPMSSSLPLRIITVSGPYTTSDNLDYQPLMDLMHVIRQERPDVVIMTGPFVDLNHPQIAKGHGMAPLTVMMDESQTSTDPEQNICVPFDVFFANKISQLLEDLFVNENDDDDSGDDNDGFPTQFVIVPSLDDATAEWVYPQPPMADRIPNGGKTLDDQLPSTGALGIEYGTLGLHHVEQAGRTHSSGSTTHRRVHLVPNPCTLSINELVVGVTSTDILCHLSADETNGNLEPFSRLPRLALHLLQQRNYYPLFPPHPTVPLDWKRRDQWAMNSGGGDSGDRRPDLLILPSKLQCFAKTLLGTTVVVNPGRLTRETTGGTFAMMEIQPLSSHSIRHDSLAVDGNDGSNAAESDDDLTLELSHRLPDRIQLEIKHI